MSTFTQADWDNINSAIASGESVVQIGNRRVEYRSFPEMLQARRLIGCELGLLPKSKTILVAHDSGRPPLTAFDRRFSGF